jgi:tripartite-type tricarboxylate transporter receptor subunit TctC
MKLPRRQFLNFAAGAAALPALSHAARAQAYPTRPVRWIVASAAGSALDIVARVVGQWLSDRFGQAFVIENRPGAGGNIGAEAAVRAAADGYTLLQVGINYAINVSLYEKLGYDLIRDITPIASIMGAPLVMVVHPSFPAQTVPDFIAYAKANPGNVSFASAGNGTPQHVSGEMFKMMTGVNIVHVPYRGAPAALTDLLGGQVQVIFETMPPSIEYIRAGRLRPLAVTSRTRAAALPDVPTLNDFVPGFEAAGWQGVGAPKNIPTEIVSKLNTEINAALNDANVRSRLMALGGILLPQSPDDFRQLIADETEKWAKVVKFGGIKPE